MLDFKHDRPFQIALSAVLIVISFSMIAPMIHLLAISLSDAKPVAEERVIFWPIGFNLDVYETIFQIKRLWRSFGITVYITVVGTLITLVLSAMTAYPLSRSNMKGRKALLKAIIATFIFSIPLIPGYLTVRALGMENTLWALMIPGATGAFYIVIMKSFFQGISSEMFDSAKLDGCSEYGIMGRIVIPLSKPVLATIALFHAVGQWNAYFGALIYLRDAKMMPLQIVLRSLVIDSDAALNGAGFDMAIKTPEMVKAGITLFVTVPILIVYPFLQKYFVKGAMLGSLKE
ncbi:carbohydrate ABC transporter permease [Paenibacillus cymbidii]|uniref:carbohydrate ABC transporter permease n=1 Tax=Paenibacillus cymbidii TaxID=1639034 RepID=UPI0010806D22|nr:carbohydrate ABC transporter permease [Paenibacillus cymbidii]